MASFEEARRASLPTQTGARGSTSFDPLMLGSSRGSQSNLYRSEYWPNASARPQSSIPIGHQDDSESDPSSGQEASPDYSDTDSSSGEATITAGPTSKGNLIGRAAATAANAAWKRHGGADAWSDKREDLMEDYQANPSTSSSLTRSRSNPAGSGHQSYHSSASQVCSYETGAPQRNVRNAPSSEHQRKDSVNRRWRSMATAESSRNPQAFTSAVPLPPAPSASTLHYMYPHSAMPSNISQMHQSLMDKTVQPASSIAQDLPRKRHSSSTISMAIPIKPSVDQEMRSRHNDATVSRTASLPKMSRLHGFSPITPMHALHNEPGGSTPSQSQGSGAPADHAEDSSDPEGIYMNVSQSRRKRSLRRRKAASDGSRTPISPAIPLSAVSPAVSPISLSLNASPISSLLGHASHNRSTVSGDYQQNYATRTELKKRRGDQQHTYQSIQALHSAYAYHIPPRLAHQPRSDFSVASTSGGSADVSSGYTASADSADTRSDLNSPGALGLSLGMASDTAGRQRKQSRLTQDVSHLRSVADTAQWDSAYTDTAHSPSPILSAFETDLPTLSLPPLANGLAQSSRFPTLILMLRLLAVVPATLGALRLMWDAILPSSATLGHVGHSAGDNLMSLPWAALTGMFCFELTTGLTHRWLLYYSLAPTLLRLVSLQSICWPSTFITLKYFGDFDILFAWIVVATTTACSRSVQIWVTSNVPEISGRILKPAALAVATGSKGEPGPRGSKDVADRHREAFDQNRKKSRQAMHVWLRERVWDWNQIIGAVWIRVGILYIITTAYLVCHRHL